MGNHLALVPSFDSDAERAVLSAIFLAPDEALAACTDVGLRDTDFDVDAHRVLYRAFLALRKIGQPIDPVTVGGFLERHAVLERVGGRDYVFDAMHFAPTAANVRHHAKLVRYAAKARAGRDDRAAVDVQMAQVGEAQTFLDLPATAFLRMPWRPLDDVLGGTMPGALCFLAGHPGGGKTSFLMTLLTRLLADGKRVYYAGLETRPNVLRAQVACRVLNLDHSDVLAGNAQLRDGWPAVRERIRLELDRQRDLEGPYSRLRFAPHSHIDVAAAATIMAEAADFGADVVIVDHIDHVTAEAKAGPYIESRQVVQVFDTLTKHHALKTIAATQTNHTDLSGDIFRNHRPIREQHLYMGGHKHQVAHWILGVYRPIANGGRVPKDLLKAIREDPRRIVEALAPHTCAVNVMKARVLGEGKHAVVTLGFWRGEVLDAVPKVVRPYDGSYESGAA